MPNKIYLPYITPIIQDYKVMFYKLQFIIICLLFPVISIEYRMTPKSLLRHYGTQKKVACSKTERVQIG